MIKVTDAATGLNKADVKVGYVYSNNSNIVVEGLAAKTANIYSVSGVTITSVLIKSKSEIITVTKGYYLVKIEGENFKLLIQ